MGILDEAIREHIELKRKHGADDTELRELEDDAFGPPSRPGEAEAAPTVAAPAEPPAAEPPLEPPAGDEPAMEHPTVEPPPLEPAPAPEPEAESVAPEGPGPGEPPPSEGASIVDQPTELYEVEDEIAPPESPSAEDLAEEEISEPRLAPPEPIEGDLAPPAEPEREEEAPEGGLEEGRDDDFFSEQSLSDELDQALDAPETEEAPAPMEESPSEPREPQREEPPREEPAEEPESSYGREEEEGEDVLEETPEFLQDTPEHDRLWFEQRPPKDFDFDD